MSKKPTQPKTPWPTEANQDPRKFLPNVAAWPGMGRVELLREHSTDAELETMKGFLAECARLEKQRNENDFVSTRQKALRLFSQHGGEGEGEILFRAADKMSITDFEAARDALVQLDVDARKFASAHCLSLAERIRAQVFIPECLEAEARLARHAIPLSIDLHIEGQAAKEWYLHADPVLNPVACGLWFLEHHFAPEYLKPRYHNESPLELFSQLTQ